jgi:hypothetical protein
VWTSWFDPTLGSVANTFKDNIGGASKRGYESKPLDLFFCRFLLCINCKICALILGSKERSVVVKFLFSAAQPGRFLTVVSEPRVLDLQFLNG